MVNPQVIKNAQKTQLIIMDAIHELCVTHNLTYYLIGGTALGAVRHKGFIPWDVDIDIAMPRKDYELFINKYSRELAPNIECKNYKNTKGYLSPHAVAVLVNSKLVLRDDILNNIDRQVYIDIMPLDNVPKSSLAQQFQARAIKFIKYLKKIKDAKCFATNSKAVVLIKKTRALLLYPFSLNYLNKIMDKVMRLSENRETGYLCSMASHFSYQKQMFEKEIYGTPQEVSFEGRSYFAPEQLDYYLKRLYGDYMKLPSKESQERQMEFIKDVQTW